MNICFCCWAVGACTCMIAACTYVHPHHCHQTLFHATVYYGECHRVCWLLLRLKAEGHVPSMQSQSTCAARFPTAVLHYGLFTQWRAKFSYSEQIIQPSISGLCKTTYPSSFQPQLHGSTGMLHAVIGWHTLVMQWVSCQRGRLQACTQGRQTS